MIVEDSFSIHREGCIITGIVYGETISAGDRVWIIRADGSQTPVKVGKIEAFLDEELKKVGRADAGTRIGFWTKDVTEDAVLAGSVVSSTVQNLADGAEKLQKKEQVSKMLPCYSPF